MGKRILLGYSTVYGKDISYELINKKFVDMCFNASEFYCYEEENGKIVNFNQDLGRNANYGAIIDENSIPMVSKNLLESMLPYESMSIELAQRRNGFPIFDWELEKRNYYKHVRFWNYILEKYNINYIFFEEAPHISYTYVIYALGIVKNIPILITNPSMIKGIRPYGNRIETLGNNIKLFYEKMKECEINEVQLEGRVKDYYDGLIKRFEDNDCDNQINYKRNELKWMTKNYFGKGIGFLCSFEPYKYYFHIVKQKIFQKKTKQWFNEKKKEVKYKKEVQYLISYYKKFRLVSQKKYNQMALNPIYSEKFIYYALQFCPEETILPRAGVFSEQFASIQILARAAQKCGVWVYVKEHFAQPFRDRDEYDIIRNIPNVKLIKTSVDSKELIKNSIAVSTQTGSCILEAAVLGKPALIFGSGNCWKGIPMQWEIEDEEQCEKVILKILNGVKTDKNEIKKYFYAIQQETLECYYQRDYANQRNLEEHKESIPRIISLIETELLNK